MTGSATRWGGGLPMPYEWRDSPGRSELTAWPFRSLPRQGFVWMIGLAAAGLALPLIAVVGSAILWGILPFAAAAVGGLWFAVGRTYRSGETRETLAFDADRLVLTRHDPGRPLRRWEANPYWVRPVLRPSPVEDYLTLTDGKRELELGAFLTAEERRALHGQILRRLAEIRR